MDYHSVSLSLCFTKLYYLFIQPQLVTSLVVVILILLLLLFIVSGAEVAFFSLTSKDVNMLKTRNENAAKKILVLIEEPKVLLASLLIANSFLSIGVVVLTNYLLNQFLSTNLVPWLEFGVKVLAVTTVILLFAEVLPKVKATQNNLRFAIWAAFPVNLLVNNSFIRGISGWLATKGDWIEKRLNSKSNGTYSSEELEHAIGLAAPEKEKGLLMGIAKFGHITVKQIMRSRLDVNGLEWSLSINDVIKMVEELHYSRLPVYKKTLDEIVGIIHTKDLLPYLNENIETTFNWHKLIRPVYFIHEQKFIEELLQDFQSKRVHFAVVVDEFGGSSGIVTMEDIMEEVMGEIKDEFDEEEIQIDQIDERNFIFNGKTMIHDACRAMKIPNETFDGLAGESDSIAGLLLEVTGRFPEAGEKIIIQPFEFTVVDISKNRINKIKITLP